MPIAIIIGIHRSNRGSATAAQPCGPPQERAAWRFSAWLQVYWPRPRDDLLGGQRQLRLRALALRVARGDEQHDQVVRAVTAVGDHAGPVRGRRCGYELEVLGA